MRRCLADPQNITKRQALVELARRKAQSNLLAFTLLTLPNYKDNWHHKIIVDHLQGVEAGTIKRLMIFIPPRHGKSELASIRFPAWYLGRNPDKQIMAASYSIDLASDFGRKVRDLVADPLFREIFPTSGIADKSTSSTRFHTAKGGVYMAAGAGGPISGRGADVFMIDDPIKNREEAYSQTTRNKIYEWYRTDVRPRLQPNGSIILIQTRWHQDDLAGRILKESEEDWTVINLPAIAEKDDQYRKIGEALWPEFYPIEVLNTIKKESGSMAFNSLYQQHPTDPEGGIIKREHLRYYFEAPKHFDEMIQSWDMSFKETISGSYVVGQVWGRVGADRYLLHQFRDRIGFTDTISRVKWISDLYPQALAKLVEDKANGPAVISTLAHQLPGLIPIEPNGSKEARLQSVSPFFESGNVYIPSQDVQPWVNDYIDELLAAPGGMHDDQVDATSQALNYLGFSELRGRANTDPIMGEMRVAHAGW
jgi:predicted phage terminase large subunit-like protein